MDSHVLLFLPTIFSPFSFSPSSRSPLHPEPRLAPCLARVLRLRASRALGNGVLVRESLAAAELELQRIAVYRQFRDGNGGPVCYSIDGRPVGRIVSARAAMVDGDGNCDGNCDGHGDDRASRRWRFEFEFENGESVDAESEFSQDIITEGRDDHTL